MTVSSGLGVNIKADALGEGDVVRLGDRQLPLTVTGRHEHQNHRRTRRDEREHYDVVELEGNGTTYHLLWLHGSGSEPILRSESQWNEQESGEISYSLSGERIHSIEVVSEAEDRSDGGSNCQYTSSEPQCVALKTDGERCTNGTTYSPLLCGIHQRVDEPELAPDTDDREWYECPDCGWQPAEWDNGEAEPHCRHCGEAFPPTRAEWDELSLRPTNSGN